MLKEKNSNFNFKIRLLLKPGPILDSAALRQFTKYNIFLEAYSFFFYIIKLILDTPGVSTKNLADINPESLKPEFFSIKFFVSFDLF